MRIGRRNFIKLAASAIVAAVCKAVPSLRFQADVGKPSQTVDNLGIEGDAIIDVHKYIIDYLATKSKPVQPQGEPEELQVNLGGRSVQLMPRWGISADEIKARIDALASLPHPPECVDCQCMPIPTWGDDVIDSGALLASKSDLFWEHGNAQPMEVQIGWYDVTGT